MPAIEYEGRTINVTDDGYLEDIDAWDETVAHALAEKEGLGKLSGDQIDALQFMRQYYQKYKFFPIVSDICKNVHQSNSCVRDEFMDPIIAWKVAGLPEPDDEVISYLKR